jgi:cytochrome c biogenesis protein CcmG, thiol:disulfide interchange protein DsbE
MVRKHTGRPGLVLRSLLALIMVMALATAGWAAGKAADFTLPGVLDGKEYSLSQFKGQVVLINFFTFFCGPCRDEMPDLNKIHQENKGKGFVTIGIGLSSDPSQLRFLVKQLNLDYPVLIGTDKTSKDYGSVEVVPTTFIIDRSGNIVHKVLGAKSKADFEKLIRPLL